MKNKEGMKATYSESALVALLRAMRTIDTQDELDEFRNALSVYYANRANKELNRLWDEGILNQEKLDEIGNMHLRTPYEQ